jgi:hypothetical protein
MEDPMKPMNLISSAFKILNSKNVRVLDWITAIGFLSYGAYLILILNDTTITPYVFFGLGFFGCLLAYKRPSEIAESWFKGSFIKK